MHRLISFTVNLVLAVVLFLAGNGVVRAEGLKAAAGPYRIAVATQPSPIPLGRAEIVVQITDAAGKPVPGAQVQVLAQMPGMPMGEHREEATPVPGQPGAYRASANFQMAGKWDITVEIERAGGKSSAVVHAATGMRTGGGGLDLRSPLGYFLLAVAALLLLAWLTRRHAGRPELRATLRRTFNRATVGGVLMLVAIYFAGRYAVAHYRRPGAMSVIEAQAMDMAVMKPPIGAVPVAVAAVERGGLDATVSYTGSVVPFAEQDVSPRVTGWIRWMPFYAGNRVTRGQLLARLDAAELGSRVNERAAATTMAEHEHMIAQEEARQVRAQASGAGGAVADARQQARRAQAAVREATSDQDQAQQELVAAREERVQAEADLASAQSGAEDAQAAVSAAQADQEYWQSEIQRMAQLLKSGAVSGEEYQREKAQAENAEARLRQARAKEQQAQAEVRNTQSKIRKADAMIAAATARVSSVEAKVDQARAEVGSAAAKVSQMEAQRRAAQAAAEAAAHKIAHTAAGVQEARATLNTASVVQSYTEIRAEADGVVTQRLISPGTLVNPGTVILKVAQIRPIRLQANVAEEDLAAVRVGSRVRARVSNDPGRVIQATVTAVFPTADAASRTGVVEATVPNRDGRLLPGGYVAMEVSTTHRPSALRVPASAVVQTTQASDDVLALKPAAAVWTVVEGQEGKPVYMCTMHPQESRSDKPGKCPT